MTWGLRRTASLSRDDLASQAIASTPFPATPAFWEPFLLERRCFRGLSAGLLPLVALEWGLQLGSATCGVGWGAELEGVYIWAGRDVSGDDDNGL